MKLLTIGRYESAVHTHLFTITKGAATFQIFGITFYKQFLEYFELTNPTGTVHESRTTPRHCKYCLTIVVDVTKPEYGILCVVSPI
jgi:hypothetical protein